MPGNSRGVPASGDRTPLRRSGPLVGCRTDAVPRLNLFRSWANCARRSARIARARRAKTGREASRQFRHLTTQFTKPARSRNNFFAVFRQFSGDSGVGGPGGHAAVDDPSRPAGTIVRRISRHGRVRPLFFAPRGANRCATRRRPRSNFANRYDANETLKKIFASRENTPNRFDRPRAGLLFRSLSSSRCALPCVRAIHHERVTRIAKGGFRAQRFSRFVRILFIHKEGASANARTTGSHSIRLGRRLLQRARRRRRQLRQHSHDLFDRCRPTGLGPGKSVRTVRVRELRKRRAISIHPRCFDDRPDLARPAVSRARGGPFFARGRVRLPPNRSLATM
jgi:hypothetical protein